MDRIFVTRTNVSASSMASQSRVQPRLGPGKAKHTKPPEVLGRHGALKNRGVQNILITAENDLKGLPDAIQAVFPNTCIVHLIRSSLPYLSRRERRVLARDMRPSVPIGPNISPIISWVGRLSGRS